MTDTDKRPPIIHCFDRAQFEIKINAKLEKIHQRATLSGENACDRERVMLIAALRIVLQEPLSEATLAEVRKVLGCEGD
jgi:hypothetical protein